MATNTKVNKKDYKGIQYSDATKIWESAYDLAKVGDNSEYSDNMYNYASGLGTIMGCLRRAYYDATLNWRNENMEGRERAMWGEIGNAIHEAIVKKYAIGGRCAGEEVRGTFGAVKLSYRIDMLYREDDGTCVPLEIKSMNLNAYEGRKALYGPKKGQWYSEPGKERPKMEHILQLMAYMHFHRGSDGERAPYGHGYLHYHNKNDNIDNVFRIEYCEQLGAEIEERLMLLNKCVEEGQVPEAIGSRCLEGEDICVFCPYGGNEKFMRQKICNEARPQIISDEIKIVL